MHRFAPLLLPLLLALPAGAGGDKFDPEARARALAPYLDEQTLAALRLDLLRPDAEAVVLKLAEIAWQPGDPVERKPLVRQWLADFRRAGGKELYLLFAAGDFFATPLLIAPLGEPLVVAPLGPGAKGKEITALLTSSKFLPRGDYEPIQGAVVGGNLEARARLRTLKPEPRPDLAKAFAAAGDTAAQYLVLPTDDMRRVVEEIMPTLPKEIGGGSSTIWTHGVRWAAVGIQGPPRMELRVMVQSKDAEAARRLRAWVGESLYRLAQDKDVRRTYPEFEKVAAVLKPGLEGDRLKLTLTGEQAAALLQPLLSESRLTAARQQSLNNLKRIAVALHSYADAHKREFPATASYDRQGKPLLSWRVHILPYLDEKALYEEFKLNEPWDSLHNKKLLARMPKVYRSPLARKAAEGKTTYLAPVGKDTAFPPGKTGVLMPKDFPDGTSNTLLIVEATGERAVYWTSPEDLPYNPKEPLAGLVGKKGEEFPAALADGSARLIPVSIGLDNIRALFTRNGGEAITKEF
jgi:hypothetical protein